MRILALDSSGSVSYTHLSEENGSFTSRKQLLKVAKLGPKAFEQCAGFMRIQGGKNPLDATSVHPESYEAAEKLLEKQGFTTKDITGGNLQGLSKSIKDYKKLAEELGIGEITLRDIVKELEKPGRDPRDAVSYTHLDSPDCLEVFRMHQKSGKLIAVFVKTEEDADSHIIDAAFRCV